MTAARPEPGDVQWVLGHKELLEDHRDPWRGYLDDMRMYNRVLTEADVQELYAVAGAVAPSIVTQPQALSRVVGDTVTLTVVAEGTGPLRYQWSKDGAALAGATNASLVITNAQLSTAGAYSVLITNLIGSVTSSVAQVQINDPPVDIASGLVLHYNFDETNGVVVTDSSGKANHGTLNLSIGDGSEWVTGRIGRALMMNPTDGGNDDYVITDNPLILTNQDHFTFTFWAKLAPGSGVNPRIITPTTGHWVLWTPGTGVGFYVPAPSPQPLLDVWRHFAVSYNRTSGVYQLFVDGQRSGGEVGGRSRVEAGESQWIVGHAESLASLADAFAGALDDLRIYNRQLTGKDIAAIHALAPALAARIVTAPRGVVAGAGTALTLNVVAEGTALSYQWKKGGSNVAGATNATLTIASPGTADSGSYTVVVSNSLAQVESAAATVTIVPVLNLTAAPAVSSADFNPDFTPAKAFDGLRLSTGPNSSRWASPGDSVPHWIYVDLGEDMTIRQVLLDWEAAYGVDYTLRGRTSAEGPSITPAEWTELATVTGYAQSSHGADGADVVFDFAADRIVFQSATAEPVSTIATTEPRVRYLMLDGQTPAIGLFSVWELQVNAEGSSAPAQLSVARSGNGITISWPASVTGYVLESAPTVPSATWTAVTGVSNNSVTVTPAGTTFYRLRRAG